MQWCVDRSAAAGQPLDGGVHAIIGGGNRIIALTDLQHGVAS